MLIAGFIAAATQFFPEQVGTSQISTLAFNSMGFLLAFLLVFKTQTSYRQFWTAYSQLDGMLQINRILGRGACILMDWEKGQIASANSKTW